MYCQNCGNNLNENDVFCSTCGKKKDTPQTQTNQLNKKRNVQFIISLISFILFAIVLLILIGIVICGLFFAQYIEGWGFALMISMMFSIIPLSASFIMSIVSIVLYLRNKKQKTRIEKIFYILNWITAIILGSMFIGF